MDFQTQFDQAIDKYASGNMFGVSKIPAHAHTGSDSLKVNYNNLDNRTRFILYRILDKTGDTSVTSSVGGDFVMPFDGYITDVGVTVDTAGVTNVTTIDVKNNTVSIMSTKVTIDSTEKTSRTAVTPSLINGLYKTFITGDIFTFDITTVSTTPAKGMTIFINVVQTSI